MTLALQPAEPAIPPPAKLVRRCDLCSIEDGKGVRVLRFSLVHTLPHPVTRRRTTRGVGTILLCDRCWRNTGGKRRRMFGTLPMVDP